MIKGIKKGQLRFSGHSKKQSEADPFSSERVAYRGQASTGRAGDSNDGMLLGHGRLLPRIGQKAAEQKV